MFLSHEKKNVHDAHLNYTRTRNNAEHATQLAKHHTRLMVAKPAVLMSVFAVGAFKGATTSNPKSKRKHALISFLRTAFFHFVT